MTKTTPYHTLEQTFSHLTLRIKNKFELSDVKSRWNGIKPVNSHMFYWIQFVTNLLSIFVSIFMREIGV